MLGFSALSESPFSSDSSGRTIMLDFAFPSDVLATKSRDTNAFSEILTNLLRDTQPLVEYLSARTCDITGAQETLASPLIVSALPVDRIVQFSADGLVTSESLSSRTSDTVLMSDNLAAVLRDGPGRLDAIASLIVQHGLSDEMLASLIIDRALAAELESAAGSNLGSTLEYLSSPDRRTILSTDPVHAIITGASLGHEWQHSLLVSVDQRVSMEWAMARQVDAKSPIEVRAKSPTKPERIFHVGSRVRVFTVSPSNKKVN